MVIHWHYLIAEYMNVLMFVFFPCVDCLKFLKDKFGVLQ